MWDEQHWLEAGQRSSRCVQTLVGWTFWDPGALVRYAELGVPAPFGYVASRCAPLAEAGPDAVIAAFGSISPAVIRATFEMAASSTTFQAAWDARDDAILEGLAAYAPSTIEALALVGPRLWPVVDALPTAGRVFFASHLGMPRPTDAVLSGWHAVNCLREWRGDTHWALLIGAGLTGVESSILHNAWLGYEPDWIPISRGTSPGDLAIAWQSLTTRGLAVDGVVTAEGIALRQHLEDRTDAIGQTPWRLLGEETAERFAREFEPGCEQLLARVDVTAGPNYQPASRIRRR